MAAAATAPRQRASGGAATGRLVGYDLDGRALGVDLPDVDHAVAVEVGDRRGPREEALLVGADDLVRVARRAVVVERGGGLEPDPRRIVGVPEVLAVVALLQALEVGELVLGLQGVGLPEERVELWDGDEEARRSTAGSLASAG